MTRSICAAFISILMLPICAANANQPIEPTDPIETVVAAIRVGATDLAESSAFYREHFGFQTLVDASDNGYVVLENHGVMIVLTPAEKPVQISDEQCFVAINFRTGDLAKSVATLKASGIDVIANGESAVGKYVTLLDPSGNRLHLKELSYDHPDGPTGNTPRVYNLGIRVTDIDEALAFYEGLLGFSVFSRDYYPPVIPMNKNGNVSFMLSESASEPAPYDHRRVAFAGMAFEVRDVTVAMAELRQRGVQFLDDEPTQAGDVIHAAFVDPFGNVHELIQHVSMAASTDDDTSNSADAVEHAAVSIEDLAWMTGTWRKESDGDMLEETWSSAQADAMVGMFRGSRQGHVWLYEMMVIEQDDTGVVFRLRHFSRELTPWKSEADGPLTYPLVSAVGQRVVFENPERDRPRRFVYEREGDELTVRVVGTDGSEDVFRFTRNR